MKSRRDFLQRITASAFAVPFLGPKVSARSNVLTGGAYQGPILRVAIMGLGSYGTRVAEAMNEMGEIADRPRNSGVDALGQEVGGER